MYPEYPGGCGFGYDWRGTVIETAVGCMLVFALLVRMGAVRGAVGWRRLSTPSKGVL